MRRFSAFFLCTLLLPALTSFMAPAPEPVTITIGGGNVTINKKSVTPSWKRKACEQALGKADRVDKGEKDANNVYTYDAIGMMVYEASAASGKVTEIQAHFRVLEPDELTPRGSGFRGKVLVDGVEITSATKAKELEDKLPKWRDTGCYIEHCYRFSSKGIYIFFQFNADETELTDVSIGPDKR